VIVFTAIIASSYITYRTVYQTTIFTRCYYGGSIHKLQRWQQDIDGTATPNVEPENKKYLDDLRGRNKK
jgi:hypothetical protein